MDFGTKVRMVRHGMGLSASDFSEMCGISGGTLSDLENGKGDPIKKTVGKIERAINARGWRLVENGVVQEDRATVIFENYLDVLDDILHTLQPGQEVLFHRADDRRSSPAVLEKMAELKAKGIRFKSNICDGNTFIAGDAADYRQIDRTYFEDSDEVEAVYGDKYMVHERVRLEAGGEEHRYFVIKSKQLAATKRKDFYYWWRNGKCLAE